MDSLSAFAKGQAATGQKQRVFDWEKAARLIKEMKPECASAGLGSDWEWTGGIIFANGKPVTDSYTYLSSNWATPELDMDDEIVPCWRWEDETPGWNEDTKWPAEAIKILEES